MLLEDLGRRGAPGEARDGLQIRSTGVCMGIHSEHGRAVIFVVVCVVRSAIINISMTGRKR